MPGYGYGGGPGYGGPGYGGPGYGGMPGYGPGAGYYGPDYGPDDRRDSGNGGGMNPMKMMTSPMKMFGGNKD